MLEQPTRNRRTERREATKAEILDAAWALARTHGLAALSLRDVARAVGMQAPSLYSYFDSKHAIYDAMFAEGITEFVRRAETIEPTGDPLVPTDRLFARPHHPYTRLLLDTIPRLAAAGGGAPEREPVAGEVPNPIDPPPGCAFHPRCPFANDRCRSELPELIEADGTLVACHAVAEGRLPIEPRAA